LRELIEQENGGSGIKSGTINSVVHIYSLRSKDISVGLIKYKCRMRKPISEALRWFRERNELNNVTAARSTLNALDERHPKEKIISVNVKGASGLITKYSSTAALAPFFYYQFYTFNEHYSSTLAG
jgi:hypothetical protein